jgi:hypothetical protein
VAKTISLDKAAHRVTVERQLEWRESGAGVSTNSVCLKVIVFATVAKAISLDGFGYRDRIFLAGARARFSVRVGLSKMQIYSGCSSRPFQEERKMKKLPLLVALLALVGGLQAYSQIVYTDPAGQGKQNFGGNLALNFTVNTPVTVDALGVFNATGTGYITGPIDVDIYDLTTSTVVASAIFQGQYTPQGYDVFTPITLVTLAPGSYEVDAVGFGNSDLNGNLNSGSSTGPILNNLGGALTFTGAAWDYNTVLDFPTACSTCQAAPAQDSQFDAGTLEVPEGGAAWLYLLLAGAASIGAVLFASRSRLGSHAKA